MACHLCDDTGFVADKKGNHYPCSQRPCVQARAQSRENEWSQESTNEQARQRDLLSVGEQSCLVFAARYAYTRETGAANMVVNTVLDNWDQLNPETQAQLKREAENEATCNHEDWQRLLNR